MEVINKEKLPTGKKAYVVEDASVIADLQTILSKKYYNNNKEILDLMLFDGFYGSSLIRLKDKETNKPSEEILDNMLTYRDSFTMLTDEEYPVFELDLTNNRIKTLRFLFPMSTVETVFRQNFNGGSRRLSTPIGLIPLPSDLKKIKLHWCPEKKALVIHDHIYEGKFKNVCSKKVADKLHEQIKKVFAEAQMHELLGESMEVDYSIRRLAGDARKAKLEQLIPKYLRGEASASETISILALSGRIEYVWCGSTRTFLGAIDKSKLDDKIDIPTTLRTQLVYMYGGYKLPEDYHTWFDG